MKKKKRTMPATKEAPEKTTKTVHRTGIGKMFYLDPELAAAFDAFIDSQRIEPSQTAVFETALKMFLKAEGFWPPPPKESP